MKKNDIARKRIGIITVIMCIIAFTGAIVIEHREQELYAILAGIVVSGVLWFIRDNVFVKKPALYSRPLYHVTTIVLVTLGFLTYAMLAHFPPISSWSLKLALSFLASTSVTLSWLILARLMKVNVVPWEKIDDKDFH